MKKSTGVIVLIIGAVIGSLLTFVVYPKVSGMLNLPGGSETAEVESGEKEPLYWVAPMDPNYRRDEPGQSPMGMDLVPVYEEDGGDGDAGPGTVRISPDVVNNLGVRTGEAHLEELKFLIQTVGYVGYDEDQLVHIHPRVNGWVEKLYVRASGDPVKKGQPLYDLYSPELVNAQEELLIAMDRNADRLVTAAENRLAALRVPGQAIEELKKTGEAQQTVTFFSPQGGVVDNLDIREGFYVTPGTTIMSIGNLDQVWVDAEVFERQASRVAVGQPVTMTLDYLPGKKWQGEVDYIYPTLDPKTRTVSVRLRFDNEDNLLKPNMFAQVVIHAESGEETLVVPKEAVIRTGRSNRVVLDLGEGYFKSVNVEVGRYDEESAEILSGLSAGDKVVTSAQFLIDSESSKTSDFKRMYHAEEPPPPQSVWTRATINTVMADHRMVNVTHEAIDEWDWPEMTMDFTVADDVDLTVLQEGRELHVEVTKKDENRYEITAVHVPGAEDTRSLDDLSIDDMSLDDMKVE
ncbi:efflux RND transporter periplasmic adaptor subunit [Desulfopila inferna]|uniref:efflux RND transporter periplasmic adaptor subunit n=1 Tax=Desulfopila inferna TaxID=468528 RepID=UPI00196627C2|nr:efflux RND transporter periplasmic adaptor subunit [Desulfopila inferna]MBM9603803.1 efflux RND transporter periplasmic adaptor subunit [Desulfopila inferna]